MSKLREVSSFLRRILPSQGPYFPYSKGIQPKIPLQTIEEVAQWALRQKTDVFISLASFRDRRGGSLSRIRSFWADVDIGSGKPYATQSEALEAINTSISKGLPPPLINSSGNGLHLIWTLTEDIDESEWRERAHYFKSQLGNLGLYVDAQRTTDPVNGPRILGTINSKSNELVCVARSNAPSYTPCGWDTDCQSNFGKAGEGQAIFLSHPGAFEKRIAARTPFTHDFDGLEFDPDLIADQCLQMSALRRGDYLDEPSWTSLLGVLAACREGEAKAHEWSSQDERYDEAETQGRLERITERGYKPTTCQWFRANGQDRCRDCQRDCNSPISLGKLTCADRVEHVSVAAEDVARSDDVGGERNEIPELPEGYFVRGRFITKEKEDGGGWFKVCETVYCLGRSNDGLNKSYTWGIPTHHKSEGLLGVETFSLPASCCSAKFKDFADKVTVMNEAATDAYLRAAKGMVLESQNSEETRKHFGWNDTKTAFLLGNKLYKQGGGIKEMRTLGPGAEEMAHAYTTEGDEASWRTAAMKLMQPGQEAAAFLTLLSAGSPLHALITDEGGTVMVLRSHGSGHGKTTALAAAMSIWGRWKDIGNWSNNTKLSNQALWETVGNLPIPWDEAHVEKDEQLKERILAFSDGSPRSRLQKDGAKKTVGSAWSTFLFCTSNSDLRRRLGTMAGATEGPVARVLQLETELNKEAVQNDGGALLNAFSRHYGFAGQKIIGALLEKPEMLPALEAELLRRNQERMQRLGLPNSARFACRAITCAAVGGNLLKMVGLPDLDCGRIIRAVESMLVASVKADQEIARNQDLVSEFIRQKVGELILVGPMLDQAPLRMISGRFEQTKSEAKLYVPINIWRKWIAAFNKSDMEADREALAMGHAIQRKTIDLAADTNYPRQKRTTCIVFELDAVAAREADTEVSKIIPINRPTVVSTRKK
jgi:hypothetical protein